MIWKILKVLETAAPLIFLTVVAVVPSCPRTRYPRNFANVTNYKPDASKGTRTPGSILAVGRPQDLTEQFRDLLDLRVNRLDKCLQQRGWPAIQRRWFGVFVPSDWYVSSCTGQQLIPSRADYRLCEQKRDPHGNPIKMPVQCRGIVKPTAACPCPCNFRSTVEGNFWIVTAPDLSLLKTELARLHTGVMQPWAHERIKGCLGD